MTKMRRNRQQQTEHNRRGGQVLVLFILFATVLILFVGLGIDLGFAYITKAQLSKAVDSACLAGISNFYQGSNTAHDIALSTFRANYATNGIGGRDTTAVVPDVQFSVDGSGNRLVTVTATATIKTFFVRILPQWQTMMVSDSAQATRANLIMTLVLDRSDSMDPTISAGGGYTQGGRYLPGAVQDFLNVFDESSDRAAMVSFASTVTNNVLMNSSFKSTIPTAVGRMPWAGGTFAHGGLTNALAINNQVVVPTNQNAVKVVVFFTDGLANMVQGPVICASGASSPSWTFGGFSVAQDDCGFWPTNAPVTDSVQASPYCRTSGGCCTGSGSANKFLSIDGTLKSYLPANVILEATNRCLAAGEQMRDAGMFVYAIGLDVGTINPQTQVFLHKLANDQDSPVFDSTRPVGVAKVAGNGADLPDVFQQVAADILLRLTQ